MAGRALLSCRAFSLTALICYLPECTHPNWKCGILCIRTQAGRQPKRAIRVLEKIHLTEIICMGKELSKNGPRPHFACPLIYWEERGGVLMADEGDIHSKCPLDFS